MKRTVRIARGAYAAALGLALAACVAEDAGRRPRRGAQGAEAAPPVAPAPRVRWERSEELGSLRVVRERVRSTHLTDGSEATLRGNEAAATYGQHGAVLPVGALLVASHDTTSGVVHFAMEKRAATATATDPRWDYTVVDAAGWIVERGRITSCVRCHAEAPNDEVFGPPGL